MGIRPSYYLLSLEAHCQQNFRLESGVRLALCTTDDAEVAQRFNCRKRRKASAILCAAVNAVAKFGSLDARRGPMFPSCQDLKGESKDERYIERNRKWIYPYLSGVRSESQDSFGETLGTAILEEAIPLRK